MNRTKLTAGIFASAVVLLAGIGVGTANAGPRLSIDTAPSTITLPVPGGLSVTLTTGPGGTLKDVTVSNTGYTAVDGSATSSRVKLEDTANGVQLVVKSKNNEQRITARTDEFAKLIGSGTWVGDPFGDGVTTTIAYTVGGDETAPTVTIDSVNPAALAPEPPTASSGSSDDDDDDVSARASVKLVSGGQSRMFSVKVEVHSADASDDDDDESGASLRISLGRFKGVDQALADLVGKDLVWTAKLCDGTTQASIHYAIDADGVLSVTSVDPASAQVKSDDDKIKVRFESGERVELRARVNGDQVKIDFKERFRCDTDPATVNGSVVPTTVDDDDDDDHEDGDHHKGDDDHKGGDDGGDHHGGGDD